MLKNLLANVGQMILCDKIEILIRKNQPYKIQHLRAKQALCCFQSKFQKLN